MNLSQRSEEQIAADLITAILAVNGWTLEKVYPLSDSLTREKLSDLDTLRASSIQTIAKKLHNAGYARGDYMCLLLANRLQSFAVAFDGDVPRELKSKLESGHLAEVDRLLLAMPGVGPAVVRSFKILTGLEQ